MKRKKRQKTKYEGKERNMQRRRVLVLSGIPAADGRGEDEGAKVRVRSYNKFVETTLNAFRRAHSTSTKLCRHHIDIAHVSLSGRGETPKSGTHHEEKGGEDTCRLDQEENRSGWTALENVDDSSIFGSGGDAGSDGILAASRRIFHLVDNEEEKKEETAKKKEEEANDSERREETLDIAWIVPKTPFRWNDERMIPLLAALRHATSSAGASLCILVHVDSNNRDIESSSASCELWKSEWASRFESCRILEAAGHPVDVLSEAIDSNVVWRGSLRASSSIAEVFAKAMPPLAKTESTKKKKKKRRKKRGAQRSSATESARAKYLSDIATVKLSTSTTTSPMVVTRATNAYRRLRSLRLVKAMRAFDMVLARATISFSKRTPCLNVSVEDKKSDLGIVLARWQETRGRPQQMRDRANEGKELGKRFSEVLGDVEAFIVECTCCNGNDDDDDACCVDSRRKESIEFDRFMLLQANEKDGSIFVRPITNCAFRIEGLERLWTGSSFSTAEACSRTIDTTRPAATPSIVARLIGTYATSSVAAWPYSDVLAETDAFDAKESKTFADMTLAQLKAIAKSRGILDPKGHKGRKRTWIEALEGRRNDSGLTARRRGDVAEYFRGVFRKCVAPPELPSRTNESAEVVVPEREFDLAYLRLVSDRHNSERCSAPRSKAEKMLLDAALSSKSRISGLERSQERSMDADGNSRTKSPKTSWTRVSSYRGAPTATLGVESLANPDAVVVGTSSVAQSNASSTGGEDLPAVHVERNDRKIFLRSRADSTETVASLSSAVALFTAHDRPEPMPRDLAESAREAITLLDAVMTRRKRRRDVPATTSAADSIPVLSRENGWRALAASIREHAILSPSSNFQEWPRRMGLDYRYDVRAARVPGVDAALDSRCNPPSSTLVRRKQEGGSHLFTAPPTPIFSPGTRRQLRRQQRKISDVGDQIAMQAKRQRRRNVRDDTAAGSSGADFSRSSRGTTTTAPTSSSSLVRSSRSSSFARGKKSADVIFRARSRGAAAVAAVATTATTRNDALSRNEVKRTAAANDRTSALSDHDRERALAVRKQNTQRLKEGVARTLERILPRHVTSDRSYYNKVFRIAYAISAAFLKEGPGGLSSALLSDERLDSATKHCQYAVKTVVPLHERILSDDSDDVEEEDELLSSSSRGGHSGGIAASSEGNSLSNGNGSNGGNVSYIRAPPAILRRSNFDLVAANGTADFLVPRRTLGLLSDRAPPHVGREARTAAAANGEPNATYAGNNREIRKRRFAERRQQHLYPEIPTIGGRRGAGTPTSTQSFLPLN